MSFENLREIANQVLDRCDSTNNSARLLGEAGFPHGTWVSTRIQESGRGRLGRSWESVEGNLFLSIVLRVESKSLWTWIPIAAAVAVTECLREIDSRLDVRIKWPNDLWLKGAKVGGILCEAVGNKSGSFVILGLGLNCLKTPSVTDQKVGALSSVVKDERIFADSLRQKIIDSILSTIRKMQESGVEFVRQKYELWAAFPSGTAVEWADGKRGIVDKLGTSGELWVTQLDGQKGGQSVSLFAEDVKLRVSPKASGESLA